jgi:hypothetical protein
MEIKEKPIYKRLNMEKIPTAWWPDNGKTASDDVLNERSRVKYIKGRILHLLTSGEIRYNWCVHLPNYGC